MTEPTQLEVLLAVQRLYDEMPRWRLLARWETRRYREGLLRRLVEPPPEPEPSDRAPLLRGLKPDA